MSGITHQEVTSLITAGRLSLNNALANTEIMATLAEEGNTSDKLKQGLELIDTLEKANNQCASSQGSQKDSTVAVNSALQQARTALSKFRLKANECFEGQENGGSRTILKLEQRIPAATTAFITFGQGTIDNALGNEAILEKLSKNGYDKTRLEQVRGLFEAAARENETQEGRKGKKVGATAERDKALRAVKTFLRHFRKSCRLLFADRPELLKELEL